MRKADKMNAFPVGEAKPNKNAPLQTTAGREMLFMRFYLDAQAEQLAQELSECAEVSAALDRRMQDIRNHLAAVTEAQTNTKKREPLRLTGPLGLHAIRQKNDF